MIRPALAYSASTWHSPTDLVKPKGLAAKLQPIQNKCLQVIAGAYKATPARALETETHTPPIDLYLDRQVAVFQKRLDSSLVGQLIT